MSLEKHENEAQRIKNKVTDDLDAPNHAVSLELNGVNNLLDTPGRSYAAAFTKKDPRDERLSMYKKVANDWIDSKPGFTAQLPAELVDYYITKKKHVEYAEWEKWVQDNFNLADPAQVKILKDLCPEYFQRRVEHMKKVLDLVFTIAKIDLMGPENKEELFLLYQIQTDALGNSANIIDGIQALFRPTGAGNEPEALFKKGIFSVTKWIQIDGKIAPGAGAFGVHRAKNPNVLTAKTKAATGMAKDSTLAHLKEKLGTY
jgi:hypothetical protein